MEVSDDSTTAFFVTATDAAGDVSPCTFAGTYVEDSKAAAVTGLTTVPQSPANDNEPFVRGATAEMGSTVKVYTGGCAGDGGILRAQGSAAEFVASGVRLVDAGIVDDTTTTVFVAVTDDAGNASACASVVYTEDSTVPVAPSGLTTVSASPANENFPYVRGTAETGATVKLFVGGGCGRNPDGERNGGRFRPVRRPCHGRWLDRRPHDNATRHGDGHRRQQIDLPDDRLHRGQRGARGADRPRDEPSVAVERLAPVRLRNRRSRGAGNSANGRLRWRGDPSDRECH